MARKVDTTLAKWAARADDDIDLRMEEGIIESAHNLSALRKISFEEALELVRAKIAGSKDVSASSLPALRHL
jgi:hypothetical protein